MNLEFVSKLLVAIVALVVIGTLITPVLTPILPPFGAIGVVALYLGALGWLLGLLPTK